MFWGKMTLKIGPKSAFQNDLSLVLSLSLGARALFLRAEEKER